MASHIDVMISSTAKDLPEHRKQAFDACQRLSMFPVGMEDLGASSDDAIKASLRMVDQAEIYLAIIAFRYGYIPDNPLNPDKISITEMEYRRAFERANKIERMIFIMSDSHPITGAEIEKGEGATKLEAFKQRIQKENIVKFFDSPDDLREKIILSLAQSRFRKEVEAAPEKSLHRDYDIPEAPTAHIAHPYTLLSTADLVGRQEELKLLTQWVANPHDPVRIMNVVAIGGMGKSALTWKWFNEIAPQEMKPLAGRLWWSFYESNATFENFIVDALAYCGKMSRDEVRKLAPDERERQLFARLNNEPFLLVLDGLERIFVAYARMDANRLRDEDFDKQTANYVRDAWGLPSGREVSFTGEHRMRQSADPRADTFLRKLAQVNASRVILSTRLYPLALQEGDGTEKRGCKAIFLRGLRDDDAIELARKSGMSGQTEEMLQTFRRFDNYPLLIRTLSKEVANYRKVPGDFAAWNKANPDFSRLLTELRNEDAKSHVLTYALRGLNNMEKNLLHTIAAFRMPASYDSVAAVQIPAIFPTENDFDSALTSLEDRGLLGWDRIANRYDLHPIVRAVVWSNLDEENMMQILTSLHRYFEDISPKPFQRDEIKSVEELTPFIEQVAMLIRLKKFDAALDLFEATLEHLTHFRFSLPLIRLELLEEISSLDIEQRIPLSSIDKKSKLLFWLGRSYYAAGRPAAAIKMFRAATKISERLNDYAMLNAVLDSLARSEWHAGKLYQSDLSLKRATLYAKLSPKSHKNIYKMIIGLSRGELQIIRGYYASSSFYLEVTRNTVAVFSFFSKKSPTFNQAFGVIQASRSQLNLQMDSIRAAAEHADKAWNFALEREFDRDRIRAMRLQGVTALAFKELSKADQKLHDALFQARTANLVEEELHALNGLAELARRRGDIDATRELLDQVWYYAEQGPYPLIHADALNVLAQSERDAGNTSAAVAAATNAYKKAWCDGISTNGKICYAYAFGLKNAKAHLDALGAPYPDLPHFDPANFEPMIDEPIDPSDSDESAPDD